MRLGRSLRSVVTALTVVISGAGLVPASPAAMASQAAPEYGPASGSLVIAGGGALGGTGIFETFIELGGGAVWPGRSRPQKRQTMAASWIDSAQ